MRSRRRVSAAQSRPSASGVRPPDGSSRSRRAATSIDEVGGSARVASAPRKVISPTLSRRWYASSSRDIAAALTASIRRRAAIEPEASTTSRTRLDSRPSVTASRRSVAGQPERLGESRDRGSPAPEPRPGWWPGDAAARLDRRGDRADRTPGVGQRPAASAGLARADAGGGEQPGPVDGTGRSDAAVPRALSLSKGRVAGHRQAEPGSAPGLSPWRSTLEPVARPTPPGSDGGSEAAPARRSSSSWSSRSSSSPGASNGLRRRRCGRASRRGDPDVGGGHRRSGPARRRARRRPGR